MPPHASPWRGLLNRVLMPSPSKGMLSRVLMPSPGGEGAPVRTLGRMRWECRRLRNDRSKEPTSTSSDLCLAGDGKGHLPLKGKAKASNPVIARSKCAHWFGMTSGEAGHNNSNPSRSDTIIIHYSLFSIHFHIVPQRHHIFSLVPLPRGAERFFSGSNVFHFSLNY